VLRSYLIGRIDTQLIAQSHSLAYGSVPQTEVHTFIPPTSWIIGVKSVNGFGPVVPQLPPGKQPPWPHGIVEVLALPHTPYTVASLDGSIDWRMLAIRQQSGTLHARGAHRFQLHLRLPFVDVGKVLGAGAVRDFLGLDVLLDFLQRLLDRLVLVRHKDRREGTR
jgi:hypothetical protein